MYSYFGSLTYKRLVQLGCQLCNVDSVSPVSLYLGVSLFTGIITFTSS